MSPYRVKVKSYYSSAKNPAVAPHFNLEQKLTLKPQVSDFNYSLCPVDSPFVPLDSSSSLFHSLSLPGDWTQVSSNKLHCLLAWSWPVDSRHWYRKEKRELREVELFRPLFLSLLSLVVAMTVFLYQRSHLPQPSPTVSPPRSRNSALWCLLLSAKVASCCYLSRAWPCWFILTLCTAL